MLSALTNITHARFCAVWGVTGASFVLGVPLLNGTTAFSATHFHSMCWISPHIQSANSVAHLVQSKLPGGWAFHACQVCSKRLKSPPLQHLLESSGSACLALRQECVWFSCELMCYVEQLQYCNTDCLSQAACICGKLWSSIQFWCRIADIGSKPT